ncbi:hypothetical protein [Escherichia coli]|uniref:hypothetical protein n=1 Tax=Escherichia coli TaxID=562 RepID=UPI002036A888|nr:hypothetical protein [Escherichia coli]
MAFYRKYVTGSDDSPCNYHAPQEILQETEKRQELHESIPKTCKLKDWMLNKVVYSALIKMNGYSLTINHSICLKVPSRKQDYGTAMMKEG